MNERIIVSVDGGLGDHVSAEPAVRYLIEKVYPQGDIHISCALPRVFAHLGVPTHLHNTFDGEERLSYRKIFTFPTEGPIQQAVCFLVMHIVDFHAAALMYRSLPLLDKTVRLEVTAGDRAELARVLGGVDPRTLTLVHAGKSWQTKTFPLAWWQETVDLLAARGQKVALVGKRGSEVGNQTGLVEVNAPPGALDLRDKLSLGSLFALLEAAPVLLSNDSSLVQIAGAFDNWIVMIATCKHPDFVFPYRVGSPYYKARALYKRLLIDDLPFEPLRDGALHVEVPVPDWTPYLPDPITVALEIEKIR